MIKLSFMAENPLVYSDSGVNYDMMDPFKIACQKAALTTAGNIERFTNRGLIINEITHSRGESAYRVMVNVLRPTIFEFSQVIEGIGSKNKITQQQEVREMMTMVDDISKVLGRPTYREAAIDNYATVSNDMSSGGGTPVGYMLFIATGSSEWFANEARVEGLIAGTTEACNQTRTAWGGGESQTLVDMLYPDEAVLAGSMIGLHFPQYVRYPSENNLKAGLSIVLLECEGPQTNGLSLLRKGVLDRVAKRMELPEERRLEGYTFDIGNGQTYGEAVLAPSRIATPVIDTLLLESAPAVPIAYALHLSGHAWRKVMRANAEFTYVFDRAPEPPPIFKFIQETTGMNNKQMYSDYNMGAYYALFVEPRDAEAVVSAAAKCGQKALVAGYVEEGPKKVVIRPAGVEFEGAQLQIR